MNKFSQAVAVVVVALGVGTMSTTAYADSSVQTHASISLTRSADSTGAKLESVPSMNVAQKSSSADKSYTVTTDTPVHVVNDGSVAGWSLTVSSDGFVSQSNHQTLKGAQLMIPEGTAQADDASNVSGDAASSSATVSSSSVQILSADAGDGIGAYTDELANSQEAISLQLPGNAAQNGNYSTNLNWSMVSAPSAND